MLGKLMYGASKEGSIENYEKALALAESSPIPYIEFGYGLQLMYGEMKLAETISSLEKGLALSSVDVMQALDQLQAKKQLDDYTG